jgi:prephenate dehydrogenase
MERGNLNQLHIHIIGAGLIGTSIALALKSHNDGKQICLLDSDSQRLELAEALVKEKISCPGMETVDFVFVTTPPDSVMSVIKSYIAIYPRAIFIETASTKTNLQLEIQDLSENISRIVFSHPIAGREVNGPASARADLFLGRAWILCHLGSGKNDSGKTGVEGSYKRASELIESMGAISYDMDFSEHDLLFAQISHLPQILSTAMASTLSEIGAGVELAGQGLRDMTRLAQSEPALWLQIIKANKENILAAMAKLDNRLKEFYQYIDKDQYGEILNLFNAGSDGRKLVAGKHGQVPRKYLNIQIVIDDSPGVLGKLFALCGKVKVNIEDLQLEHSPNQETGLITLSIAPEDHVILADELTTQKWRFFIKDELSAN